MRFIGAGCCKVLSGRPGKDRARTAVGGHTFGKKPRRVTPRSAAWSLCVYRGVDGEAGMQLPRCGQAIWEGDVEPNGLYDLGRDMLVAPK
jgi:hypothetical protein